MAAARFHFRGLLLSVLIPYPIRGIPPPMTGPVHVLHISKTGGTAVKAALGPVAEAFGILLHPHEITLDRIPAGERIVFFAREPVSRFVSAFNARLRAGRPRYNEQNTADELIAFDHFSTPNALAEALLSQDAHAKEIAEFTMNLMPHVRTRLTDMLVSPGYVAERKRDIFFIGFQESLETDFEKLKKLLSLPASLSLPEDEVGAHRTPSGYDSELSERGRRAILRWYRDDIELYAYLKRLAPLLEQRELSKGQRSKMAAKTTQPDSKGELERLEMEVRMAELTAKRAEARLRQLEAEERIREIQARRMKELQAKQK